MVTRKQFKVKGMHCKSCEMLIADALEDTGAVKKVVASAEECVVSLEFDESKLPISKIKEIIKKEGFEVE